MRTDEELWALLGQAEIRFWTCPDPDHKFVSWQGDVAHCCTCNRTSADPDTTKATP